MRKTLGTLALTVALAATAGAPAMADSPKARPTIVLVHWAFADASSWNGVVARLKRDGSTWSPPPTPCAA